MHLPKKYVNFSIEIEIFTKNKKYFQKFKKICKKNIQLIKIKTNKIKIFLAVKNFNSVNC